MQVDESQSHNLERSMASANHYKEQIWEIIGEKPNRKGIIKISFSFETIPEAKNFLAKIRLMQKRLRLLKKEVNAEMKSIRSNYSAKVSNVQAGFGSSLLFGKGTAKSLAASKKREIKAQRNRTLLPYEGVKRIIDRTLVETDSAKLQVSTWLESNK